MLSVVFDEHHHEYFIAVCAGACPVESIMVTSLDEVHLAVEHYFCGGTAGHPVTHIAACPLCRVVREQMRQAQPTPPRPEDLRRAFRLVRTPGDAPYTIDR